MDVGFDPTGRYGYQEESVYVATTTGRYRLVLVARVVASDTTLSRYFPYRQGDVCLSASRVEFRGVQPSDSPVEMVEVYNAGVDTLALRIEGPSWLKAHHWRDLLPPGESEPISLQALTPDSGRPSPRHPRPRLRALYSSARGLCFFTVLDSLAVEP